MFLSPPSDPNLHPGVPGSRRWICRVCGFIYDEALGNLSEGFPPGTLWDSIPETWRCPICRVTKSDFDPLVD